MVAVARSKFSVELRTIAIGMVTIDGSIDVTIDGSISVTVHNATIDVTVGGSISVTVAANYATIGDISLVYLVDTIHELTSIRHGIRLSRE